MGTLHVTRLHPGGEPINHVVADSNRIVLVAEADDAADWTEDLLLGDLHSISHVREHGRLVIEAVGERGVLRTAAATDQLRALALADLDISLHFIQLLLGHERPHAGGEVARIPHRALPPA